MNEYEVVITFRGQILPVRLQAEDYFDAMGIAANEVHVEVIELTDNSERREAA